MSRAAIINWLRTVPLFSDLTNEELGQLAAESRSISARKHTRLFEEGASADCCFVLTSGEARVVLRAGGDSEIVLGTITPRGLVGEMALLDGSTRSATLVATRDCHFIRITSHSLDELRKNPRFEKKIVAHIISTLRQANDQVRGISTISTIARVAWCLARIARQEGTWEGTAVVIPRKTHHELAEMVGCSRETVSRKLEALKRKKCVSWDKNTMRIDLDSLQRHARTELDTNPVV